MGGGGRKRTFPVCEMILTQCTKGIDGAPAVASFEDDIRIDADFFAYPNELGIRVGERFWKSEGSTCANAW